MKKPTRKHLPCRECGTSHNNTLSSTICDSCGKKLHTENLKQAELRQAELKQAELEDEVDLGERITELEANQAKRDLEVTRKGFWLGFESARCYPSENNILMKWEETLYFKQAQELGE